MYFETLNFPLDFVNIALPSAAKYGLLSEIVIVMPEALDGNQETSLIPEPIFIDVKLLQPENASCTMLATPSGIVIDVKLLQPLNAPLPMLVTLLGIVIDVKLSQPTNA